jgi:hypothetical protein
LGVGGGAAELRRNPRAAAAGVVGGDGATRKMNNEQTNRVF